MSLDLYARAEHLLGIEEATEHLHELYLRTLESYPVETLLDIGCGRGTLMEKLSARGVGCVGIDRSAVMAEAAREKGLNVTTRELCELEETFDAAVAVFDVLNFLDPESLGGFLDDVARRLEPGGIFVADINTLHGFAAVAEGTMSAEDERHFLTVDAHFEDNELHTLFTLFTGDGGACYRKEQSEIVQWFHPLRRFRSVPGLKLVKYRNISLYDTNDKMLLVFKKV